MRREAYGDQAPAEHQQRWLLLWDGDCGFCRRSVQWVLRKPGAEQLVALPWQGEQAWLPEPVLALSTRQFHLRSPDGLWWGGGDAAIALLRVLGHGWLATLAGLPLLRQSVDGAYRLVASNRMLFSRLF